MSRKSPKEGSDKRAHDSRSHGRTRAAGSGKEQGENNGASTKSGASTLEQAGQEEENAANELNGQKGESEPKGTERDITIKYNKHNIDQQKLCLSEEEITKELRKRGEAVLQTSKELSNRYWLLCQWIFDNEIKPEIVNAILKDVGMRKERISEIKRVCFTSRQIYEAFKAKQIGWKIALERSRTTRETLETYHTKWLEFFRTFEKLFRRSPPPCTLHQGNTFNLLMWSDADCTADRGITDDNGRWHIVIQRRKSNL